MTYFARCFAMEWYNFPQFCAFCEHHKHDWKSDYKNRLHFAWKNAKIFFRHRHDYDYD